MRKAYSYIRMSTDIQLKGDSLRRQLEASQRYALENELQLVDNIDGTPLTDIGVSAFTGANVRDGVLAKFLEHLEQGKIPKNSVLLVESLDRLSRVQVVDALTQFLNIVQYEIEIVTLTDRQRYTKQSLGENPAQLFVSLGVMFRANEESATKSKRLKSVWSNKRNHASSKPVTSIAPAWLVYFKERGEFEAIPERVKVVQTIFEMCAYVCGQNSIVKYLNQNSIPVFGRSQYWMLSYIKKILTNRAVLGEYQPHSMIDGKRQPTGDTIHNYFPRIIDDELFHLAQAAIKRRQTNSSGRKGKTFANLFAGLAHCGNCGAKIFYRNRGAAGKSYPNLCCYASSMGTNCDAPEWRYSSIEKLLLKHLLEVDFSELLGKKTAGAELESQLLALQQQLREKQNGLNKLLDLVQSDELHAEAKPRIFERLNTASSEIVGLEIQVKSKQQELDEYHSQLRVFSEDALKEAIRMIEEKSDDYFFRSSVNQLLARAIARIDLVVADRNYYPWEIDESDSYVQRFMNEHPEFSGITFEKLIARSDFKQYWMQFERRVRITYKTGAIRQLLVGHDASFSATPTRKQYRDIETGNFLTEEEAMDRPKDTFTVALIRNPIPAKTIR